MGKYGSHLSLCECVCVWSVMFVMCVCIYELVVHFKYIICTCTGILTGKGSSCAERQHETPTAGEPAPTGTSSA